MANKNRNKPEYENETVTINETGSYPVLALRGIVAFPGNPMKLELNYLEDLKAVGEAGKYDDTLFLLALVEPETTPPFKNKDFCRMGCLGKITEVENSNNALRITVTCSCRAELVALSEDGTVAEVIVRENTQDYISSGKVRQLYQQILAGLETLAGLHPSATPELKEAIMKAPTPGTFADSIALTLLVSYQHKQQVLDAVNVPKRLLVLKEAMNEEIPLLSADLNIHKKVRAALEENQKEYYLKEQLKVIKDELGMAEDEDEEIDFYRQKIAGAALPKEVEEKLQKELSKLAKSPYASAEAAVERNYLDTVLEIPFSQKSEERADVTQASSILEKDHYGLKKVKERILEFVAARQLNPELKNQTLCLVGPPGVGKTSIAASLATALNRKYVRVSLGGVRDEADIRGHRKTYVAAMPGRIVDALIKAKVSNPLILLDEIDKMASDSRGDPSSAMLEVLDGEQNKTFRDHFVELPIDLSDCIFVATANNLEGVAPALIDRMEVIELASYTAEEKLQIAKKHLVPKQRKAHGITAKQLQFTDESISDMITSYTHEAGVRNLERSIGTICRKAARIIVEQHQDIQRITPRNLEKYLGHVKVLPEKVYEQPLCGVVNGLAWTEAGGELLRVEAISMPGGGKIECTGNLGTVMKESAQIALSCMRANAEKLHLEQNFCKDKDIHIHFPEGATPKDGPSAGCAIYTALVSEFTGRPVKQDVAMTGEITLHGRVLPIGGLREKAMAAYKAGAHTLLIPKDNRKDLTDLDPAVLAHMQFVFCENAGEVISNALV